MLTELQTVILTCLLGPEDMGAFKRECGRLRMVKWRGLNPERDKEIREECATRNPRAAKKAKLKWEQNNREVHLASGRRRYHKNAEKILAKKKEKYYKDPSQSLLRWLRRYNTDENFRLAQNIRTRIRRALKKGSKKIGSTTALIGCSFLELKSHLESLFKPGMTWENYGPVWHIDHIKPCAKFDLTDPEQQKLCFHWSNQQPLFALENIKKGDKYAG